MTTTETPHATADGSFAALTDQFLSAGFLLIPNVLGADDVERFGGVLRRLDREVDRTPRGDERRPGDPLEVRDAIGRAPEVVDLAANEFVLSLMCSIMGYNIQVHTSHAFLRPGFPPGTAVSEQRGLGWHYDMPGCAGPINGRHPWLYTRVGYVLSDLTQPNTGSIKIVPGSHRVASRPPGPADSEDPFGAMEILATAGSVVVMDQRLWHATVPNYSPLDRLTIYVGYSWRWIRPMDYRSYPEELLAGKEPAVRQLLGDVTTQLGYVFPQDADLPLRSWCEDRGLRDLPKVRMP